MPSLHPSPTLQSLDRERAFSPFITLSVVSEQVPSAPGHGKKALFLGNGFQGHEGEPGNFQNDFVGQTSEIDAGYVFLALVADFDPLVLASLHKHDFKAAWFLSIAKGAGGPVKSPRIGAKTTPQPALPFLFPEQAQFGKGTTDGTKPFVPGKAFDQGLQNLSALFHHRLCGLSQRKCQNLCFEADLPGNFPRLVFSSSKHCAQEKIGGKTSVEDSCLQLLEFIDGFWGILQPGQGSAAQLLYAIVHPAG